MKFDLSKENTLLQVELAKVKRRGEELQTVLDLQSSSGYASQSSGPSLALLSQLQLRRHPETAAGMDASCCEHAHQRERDWQPFQRPVSRRLAVRAANCGREQAGELLRVDTMCFEVLRFETNRVLLNVQVHQLCGGESQHCEGEAFGSIWAPNGFRRAQKKATSTRPAPLARLECAGALRAAQHTALCSAALAMAAEVQRYVTPYVYTYISTCTLYVSFSSHS